MNSLSWSIYLIHIIEAAHAVVLGVIIASSTAIALMALGMFISEGELYTNEDTGPWAKKWTRRAQVSLLAAIPLFVVIPSKQTVLLVAGSEIGERLISSDAVKSVADPGAELLREWIKTETERLRGTKSK